MKVQKRTRWRIGDRQFGSCVSKKMLALGRKQKVLLMVGRKDVIVARENFTRRRKNRNFQYGMSDGGHMYPLLIP